jgi:DNA-nicking Smr family endonuclease
LIKKITDKDKKSWLSFIKSDEKLEDKDFSDAEQSLILKEKSIDLHGYSLDEANKIIYDFIMSCYEKNVVKINVITGKGSRSKNKNNPYQSKNLSILKYSVPDYINSNQELLKIIKSFDKSEIESSSKGSFVILLKKKK